MIIYKSPAVLLSLLAAWAGAQGYSADPMAEIEEAAEKPPAAAPPVRAARSVGESGAMPVYMSLADSIHDFGRFADGGSDSNWFVGFNNAWVVKLPPAPEGRWARVFIGAKLGRAKTVPRKDKPWEHRILPGKVYIGVSQRPAFSSEQSFFLADTADIPVEAHESLYLPGIGQSEWFWAEVPRTLVSSERPNYLIVWSPNREFRSAETSPILAAADSSRGGEPRAWNNHTISGVPPRQEEGALPVPITLKPGLAIKLVPASATRVSVSGFSAETNPDGVLGRFSAEGRDVELAWVESSQDQLEWTRVSPYRRSPPYVFRLSYEAVAGKGSWMRGRARDGWGNEGGSAPLFVPGTEGQ
jgi:hypothetical protein